MVDTRPAPCWRCTATRLRPEPDRQPGLRRRLRSLEQLLEARATRCLANAYQDRFMPGSTFKVLTTASPSMPDGDPRQPVRASRRGRRRRCPTDPELRRHQLWWRPPRGLPPQLQRGVRPDGAQRRRAEHDQRRASVGRRRAGADRRYLGRRRARSATRATSSRTSRCWRCLASARTRTRWSPCTWPWSPPRWPTTGDDEAVRRRLDAGQPGAHAGRATIRGMAATDHRRQTARRHSTR